MSSDSDNVLNASYELAEDKTPPASTSSSKSKGRAMESDSFVCISDDHPVTDPSGEEPKATRCNTRCRLPGSRKLLDCQFIVMQVLQKIRTCSRQSGYGAQSKQQGKAMWNLSLASTLAWALWKLKHTRILPICKRMQISNQQSLNFRTKLKQFTKFWPKFTSMMRRQCPETSVSGFESMHE